MRELIIGLCVGVIGFCGFLGIVLNGYPSDWITFPVIAITVIGLVSSLRGIHE